MRPKLARLQRIEQYLNGAASAPDEPLEPLLDGDWQVDIDLQRQLYQGLRLAGQQQLRQELHQIHQRLYRRRGWVQAATAQLRQAWHRLRR